MNRYDGVRRVKRILVAGAVLIVVASLWVSHGLISDLKNEEQTKCGLRPCARLLRPMKPLI